MVASSSPLTISAGMTETSLIVTIISDTVFEGNKTLEISLTSLTASANLRTPPSLGARRTARVVIVEDDQSELFLSLHVPSCRVVEYGICKI